MAIGRGLLEGLAEHLDAGLLVVGLLVAAGGLAYGGAVSLFVRALRTWRNASPLLDSPEKG